MKYWGDGDGEYNLSDSHSNITSWRWEEEDIWYRAIAFEIALPWLGVEIRRLDIVQYEYCQFLHTPSANWTLFSLPWPQGIKHDFQQIFKGFIPRWVFFWDSLSCARCSDPFDAISLKNSYRQSIESWNIMKSVRYRKWWGDIKLIGPLKILCYAFYPQ